MNDEILILDTEQSLEKQVISPLPLYDERFDMLRDEIPLYTEALPNPDMNFLVKRMKMTMKLYGGIGLSANQCGVYKRVFIIGMEDYQLVCINPKILSKSDKMIKAPEGCLSYPGLFVKIERPESIQVEFTTESGETKQMYLDGLTARCFQHELEHMDGKSFLDHVGPVTIKMARKYQEKRMKKAFRNYKNGIHV